MITVLLIMLAGMICGYIFKEKKRFLKAAESLSTTAIFLLLFMLGIGVGLNEAIIAGIDTIGWQAASITVGAIAGSLILALLTYVLFFEGNYEK